MIVNKTLSTQQVIIMVREALEHRGYNVKDVELVWKSSDFWEEGYVKAQIKLDV